MTSHSTSFTPLARSPFSYTSQMSYSGYHPGMARPTFATRAADAPISPGARDESAAGPAKREKRRPSSPYHSRSSSRNSLFSDDGEYRDDDKDADWSPATERHEWSPVISRRRASAASSATSEWEGDAQQRLGALTVGEAGRNVRLEQVAKLVQQSDTPSATDRHRNTFVHIWLTTAYTTGNSNTSRQPLYASYGHICEQYGVKPVNAASFGKAVRAAFPGIKTRRLGVRGCSRYHYCGMQPATAQEQRTLDHYAAIEKNGMPAPTHTRNRSDSSTSSHSDSIFNLHEFDDEDAMGEDDHEIKALRHVSSAPNIASPMAHAFPVPHRPMELERHRRHTASGSFLPAPTFALDQPSILVANRLPGFPSFNEGLALTPELNVEPVRAVWTDYETLALKVLDVTENHRLDMVESLVRSFYERQAGQAERLAAIDHPVLSGLMLRGDAVIYDAVLALLGTRLAEPVQQESFTTMRQLADTIENITMTALQPFSVASRGPKIELAARFGHLLARHLGLCQLAQALATIIGSQAACQEMAKSFAQIDLEHIRNHCALSFGCRHEQINNIFNDCSRLLADRAMTHDPTLDSFVAWLEVTYEQLAATSGSGRSAPRNLLLQTNFVCSQVLRDLTLRSDPTFGSFQIAISFMQEAWGLRVMRGVALHVNSISASVEAAPQPQPPSEPTGPAGRTLLPAPLALRPAATAYHGSSYLAVSPAQARFDDLALTSATHGGIAASVSPRTAQAFEEAATYTTTSMGGLAAPLSGSVLLSAGQTPTPMAMTFADRWSTAHPASNSGSSGMTSPGFLAPSMTPESPAAFKTENMST